MPLSAAEPPKKFVDVLGHRMAYVEIGEGDPIVFLHGNPTSSYLWRNVMPHLEGQRPLHRARPHRHGRLRQARRRRAPTATASSSTAATSTRCSRRSASRGDVTLVIHDWGSALGFDWANRHRDAVRGIAYMEAIVRPVTWDGMAGAVRPVFQGFRSPAGEADGAGEERLRRARAAGLGPAQADRRGDGRLPPALRGAGRGPPADADLAAADPDRRRAGRRGRDRRRPTPTGCSTSDVPKLFVNAEPGAILRGAPREFCRTWPNQTEVTVKGSHFLQEDSPDEIGRAVADWRRGI